ncbi:hypothetical protein EVAR_14526_1 [Eumeta japonica]|uniref:Protein kinase domain-containing protein n=1 Tax=Eumeta variegata TaxID=151549 RepID=A0A4C1U3G0_EUMVA|nr:hypothetical protein EVAR_14526_1 [Eumeta japonica]
MQSRSTSHAKSRLLKVGALVFQAADIWSLGVTLFAMVTGRVPWYAASAAELQRRIQNDPLVFPSKLQLSEPLKNLLVRMLDKDPAKRATVHEIKVHEWVTCGGKEPLPSEQENCRLVEVTDEDMARVVTSIPNLSTLILIKTMLKKHSFQNPFLRSREGSRATEGGEGEEGAKGGRARPGLARSGRSLSAPGNYLTDRQASFDIGLESVVESRDPSQDVSSREEMPKAPQNTAAGRDRNVKLDDGSAAR